jgi:exonuclease III
MKIVAWNCRGLDNRPAVRGLMDLQKSEAADILFLSEMKLDRRMMERFRWMLGLPNMVVKDAVGKGGMAVLWRRGIDLTLRNTSKYHINMDVKEDDGVEWRFTGIYGEAHSDKKHKTWQDMRDMIDSVAKPWLCVGDFNEILFSHEKEGGREQSQAKMDRFREALEVCKLHDLGFGGIYLLGGITYIEVMSISGRG